MTTFDRTRIYPERVCECGTGCGLTFRLVPGQRSRRFHKACPARREQLKKEAREYQRRKAAENNPGPRRVRKHSTEGRDPNDWCGTCAGLEHRRAVPCCPECLEPFRELPALDVMQFARRTYEPV